MYMESVTRQMACNRITVHSISGIITMQKEQQQQWVEQRVRNGDKVLESIFTAAYTLERHDTNF